MQRGCAIDHCQDERCPHPKLAPALHAVRTEAPALAPPPTALTPSSFTFTLRGARAMGAASAGAVLGGVARIAPTPVSHAAPAPHLCR